MVKKLILLSISVLSLALLLRAGFSYFYKSPDLYFGGSSYVFGDNNIKASDNPFGGDIDATVFQFTGLTGLYTGDIYSYLTPTTTPNNKVIYAIYKDSDKSKLAETSELTDMSGAGWKSKSVNGTFTLTNGQSYWLALHSPSGTLGKYSPGTGGANQHAWQIRSYDGTMPATLTAGGTEQAIESIYLSYTPYAGIIRSLKALFNYGINTLELTIKNPCQRLEFYPIDIKLKHIPSNEEIIALRAVLSQKQALLFDFVEETGCRIMEAIRLEAKDVDEDRVVLYTRKAKNSNLTPRIIPRPVCLKGDFKGRIFDEWNAYPRFLEDLVDWNWHNLRHRRASIWVNDNMPIFEIMSRLGHNNMATTMRYLQLLGFTRLSPV